MIPYPSNTLSNQRGMSTAVNLQCLQQKQQRRRHIYIGIYNIRTLDEKLLDLEKYFEGMLGNVFHHEGKEKAVLSGIGFLIYKRHFKNALDTRNVISRAIYVILTNKLQIKTKIVQIHVPIACHTDIQMEECQNDISGAINENQTHFTLLVGNFNSKKDDYVKAIGPALHFY